MEQGYGVNWTRLLLIVICFLLVVSIGVGAYFYIHMRAENAAAAAKVISDKAAADLQAEITQVQQSFVAQNGDKVKIMQSAVQTKIYITEWQDEKYQYISALIGGVWLKLINIPLTPAASSNPATP